MKRRKPRLKIIPNKVFHKIWKLANSGISFQEYMQHFSSAAEKPLVNLFKYHLDFVEQLEMLRNIYEAASYSFREIVQKAGVRQAQISDVFCIPIRTVEEWYKGTSKCAAYIRLMILKEYHLLQLGRYVRLESDVTYMQSTPPVYERHAASTDPTEPAKQNAAAQDVFDDDFSACEKIHPKERTSRERKFFEKYGFYPGQNVLFY